MDDAVDQFRAAVDSIVDKAERLDADLLEEAPAPGEWSVKEIAAHTAEIFNYWARQLEHLSQRPGTAFGRTVADPARAAFVETHKHTGIDDLIRRIRVGEAEVVAAVRSFDADQWQGTTGTHLVRGEMTIEAIFRAFLLEHAEDHRKQIDETVKAVS